MNSRLRTLNFKVPVSLVLLFLSNPSSSHAQIHEFHVGAEAQVHRETVTPSFFPILNVGANLKSESYVIEGDFRISPNHPKAFALTGKNLYYGESDNQLGMKFSFGRRLKGWTGLDEMWGLGEFEPLDSWDRLRSSPQGLTGIFATVDTDLIRFEFFGSFLFVPEITPNIVIENNRFKLEHPQAIASAPQTFTLLNRPTPLGYELKIPSISSIIFRPSAAFSAETRRENAKGEPNSFFSKISYGYLPLNYFPIALQAGLNIPIDTIIVELRPRLLHHHLVSAEVAYQFNKTYSGGLMGLFNSPIQDVIPLDYTTTPLSESWTWSPWMGANFGQLRLTLSQIWTTGGLEADVGEHANPNSSIFSSRVLYRNATQLKLRYLFSSKDPKSNYIDAKYLHEHAINADWIAADFVMYLKQNLSLLIGGDLINAERTVAPSRGAEFLADVRAIDRFRVGVQYVF